MKYFTLLRSLLFISSLAVFIAACTSQERDSLPTPTATLSVVTAHTWYEATYPPTKTISTNSVQGDASATNSTWVLNWSRAIALNGPQSLVLVPLQGDVQRFANQPVKGTRYLVVAQESNTTAPTGLIVELLLQQSTTPVDTVALFTSLYQGYLTGTPSVPVQGTGSVLFYSADYHYHTGRRFVNGVLQPGTVHLAFQARNPTTTTALQSSMPVSPDGPTSNYIAPICMDIYQILDDGTMLYVTSTGDCSNLPPPAGDGGGGTYGGQGDGGWGGDSGGGGGDSNGNPPNPPTTSTAPTTIIATLPPCVGGTLSQLQNMNGNDIGGLFQFFTNTPYTDWLIKTGYLQPDSNGKQRNAVTVQLSNGPSDYVETTLNTDFTSTATNVAIARTLIHESFHAYLERWVTNQGMNANRTTSQLVTIYMNSTYPNDILRQHSAMAAFVNQMASALQQTFPNLDLTSGDYAQNLFWASLTDTQAYSYLTTAQKAAIYAANAAEVLSKPEAKGTKSCN